MVNIYENRWLKTRAYLHGQGLEIGAGVSPQKLPEGSKALYFDKRTTSGLSNYFGESIQYEILPFDDLPKYFPNGADFLIAHHVLEHTPDPIGALRLWHTYVRYGGVFVVSVPYFKLCPDRDRLLPDFDHLLLDHLLDRDGDSFESREHVLSFLCSWIDDAPGLVDLTKSECCRKILSESKRSGHDFHWHAFNHQLFLETVYAAALLNGYIPDFYEVTSQDENTLDILYVYTLKPATIGKLPEEAERVLNNIRAIRNKINEKTLQLDHFSL